MPIYNFPYRLKFKTPFKIASVERTGTDNLYLKFTKDGFVGWGEAVFPPYIEENQQTAIIRLADLNWGFLDEAELFRLIQQNQIILKQEPSLSCAMECCLLNWLAASKKIGLHALLGLNEVKKETSYTIGISSDQAMEEKVVNTPEATYFKLKVNENEIERIVNTYVSLTSKPFVVDANQSFSNREKALYWAFELDKMGVAYFEQPFDKEDFESHEWLKNHVNIPIIADESFQRITDLEKAFKSFDGINVKIIKTGGVLEAKRCLLQAKKLKMITVLGCMSGSSTSIQSASALSDLADFVDLDGVYLIENDPDLNKMGM